MSSEERLAHQAQAWKQKTDEQPAQQQDYAKYRKCNIQFHLYGLGLKFYISQLLQGFPHQMKHLYRNKL